MRAKKIAMAFEEPGKLPGKAGAGRTWPGREYLFFDVAGFVLLVYSCFGKAQRAYKQAQIKKILADFDWVVHYEDKDTGRKVLAEGKIEHEKSTAVFLAQMDYDVVFAPAGMFKRADKKFDVFLLKDTIVLRADLKCIYTKNPDNIAKRIKEGSEQASRLVVNVISDAGRKALTKGLRSGVERNKLITEILLIYKGKLYKLPKALILKNRFSI